MTEIQCSPHPDGQRIAATIQRQIGTDALLAVSARDQRFWTNSTGDVVLAFRFGSRYGLPHWIEITYTVADDYDIVAYRIHRNGSKRVLTVPDQYTLDGLDRAEYEGIHADALPRIVRYINLMGDLS